MSVNTYEFATEQRYMFGFNYNGGAPTDVIVETPSLINDTQILFHFLHGHHSLGEFINKSDIIAVGDDKNGTVGVKGWSGKYVILNEKLFNQYKKTGALELK
ncbi:MAG: hypothetical protein WCO55_03935 [Candidatus Falkowbacteria bacterium]